VSDLMPTMKPAVRTITVGTPAPCLTCEEPVEAGEKAQWCPTVGVWHIECARPKNLEAHFNRAAKMRELGL
jgi:hypothetical protein